MSSIKFKISGKFCTGNLLHDHYEEGKNPAATDIITTANAAEKLITSFKPEDLNLELMATNSKGASIKIPLSFKNATDVKNIELSFDQKKPSIVLSIDATFNSEIDSDDTKELKKYFKSGKLGFYFTTIKLSKTSENPFSYSHAIGFLEGGNWDLDESWHKVTEFESIIFDNTKPTKPKKSNDLELKLKGTAKANVIDLKSKGIENLFGSNPSIRISITIPNGSNSLIFKKSELTGVFDLSSKDDVLTLKLSATCQVKIDSWIKKYKDSSPFPVELSCIFDKESNLHYFGKINKSGYYDSPLFGELNIDSE